MKTGNMVAITHKAEQETERVKLESLNTSPHHCILGLQLELLLS